MGSIYGDTLLHFAEQYQSMTYFNMIPRVNSGYDPILDQNGNPVEPEIIQAIIHALRPKTVTDSNGNLVTSKGLEIWSMRELTPGYFVNDTVDTFRILPENKWAREAGFFAYGIERVVGDNGVTTDITFDRGTSDFQ